MFIISNLSFNFKQHLSAYDNTWDHSPFGSIVNNIFDIYQKLHLPESIGDTGPENRYYRHIRDKSYIRCALLAIPFVGLLGNFYTLCSDSWRRYKTFADVSENGLKLRFAPQEYKEDKGIVLAAIRQDPNAFRYASKDLQQDEQFIQEAVQVNGNILELVDLISPAIGQKSGLLPLDVVMPERIKKLEPITLTPTSVNLKELLTKEETSDVTIEINEVKFPLHKEVLNILPYFGSLFKDIPNQEVFPLSIPFKTDVPLELLFPKIISWLYTLEIKFSPEEAFDLYKLADFLGLQSDPFRNQLMASFFSKLTKESAKDLVLRTDTPPELREKIFIFIEYKFSPDEINDLINKLKLNNFSIPERLISIEREKISYKNFHKSIQGHKEKLVSEIKEIKEPTRLSSGRAYKVPPDMSLVERYLQGDPKILEDQFRKFNFQFFATLFRLVPGLEKDNSFNSNMIEQFKQELTLNNLLKAKKEFQEYNAKYKDANKPGLYPGEPGYPSELGQRVGRIRDSRLEDPRFNFFDEIFNEAIEKHKHLNPYIFNIGEPGENYYPLWDSKKNEPISNSSDLTIVASGKEFKAHKKICGSIFSTSEITFPPELFSLFLEFLYTGQLSDLPERSLEDISTLLIHGLQLLEKHPLYSSFILAVDAYMIRNFNEMNLVRIFDEKDFEQIAKLYRLPQCQTVCLNRRIQEIRENLSSSKFRNLIIEFPDSLEINLSGTEYLKGEDIEFLKDLPNLNRLILAPCPWVKSDSIRHLSSLKRLQWLDIHYEALEFTKAFVPQVKKVICFADSGPNYQSKIIEPKVKEIFPNAKITIKRN